MHGTYVKIGAVCMCWNRTGITNCPAKGGSTLVTLPRNVTPYRDSVDVARDRVTYQKLVTR